MVEIGKFSLLFVQCAGVVLALALVVFTFGDRERVEDQLRSFAISEVEAEARAVWGASGLSAEGSQAQRLEFLADRLGLDAREIETERKEIVAALIALSRRDRCQRACSFWEDSAAIVNGAMLNQIKQLRVGQSTLAEFVAERYEARVDGMVSDLRRFGLVNLIALSLLAGLGLFKDRLDWRFSVFSLALTAYTAWASYGYVFEQNWAMSLLLQDWAARGYQAGMVLVSIVLFDWLFLRGAVTSLVASALTRCFPG